MNVFFKQSFLKDFKRLPEEIKNEVRNICLSVFPKIKSLREFQTHPLKKMKKRKITEEEILRDFDRFYHQSYLKR